jgi:aryl-alcohol dehydrogenase-like predicted oxidoreductase
MAPDRAGLGRRHVLLSVDESLRRLQTDYIDLYQIHHWDPATPLEETLEAFAECVNSGKVREVGCSNLTAWQLVTALGISDRNGWPAFVSLQIEHSLLQRGSEIERFPACEYHGLGALSWSPLGHGILTGKYRPDEPAPVGSRGAYNEQSPSADQWYARLTDRAYAIADTVGEIANELGRTRAQVALRWNIEHPDVTAPIIGARTPEQLEDNLGSLGWNLPEEHRRRLDEVSSYELPYWYVSPRGFT